MFTLIVITLMLTLAIEAGVAKKRDLGSDSVAELYEQDVLELEGRGKKKKKKPSARIPGLKVEKRSSKALNILQP